MDDVLFEILKSTASAITWAVIGSLWLFGRNRLLERKLKKTFGNHGLNMSIEGIGISLTNPTAYEIIVRRVHATCGSTNFGLNYDGSKTEINDRGYVTLPPFSDGTWLLPRGIYQFQKGEFTEINVEFLYPSLFGSLKQITVKGDQGLISNFNLFRKKDEADLPRLEQIKQDLIQRGY